MLNKSILMGRLVRDPELRRTNNNTAVASFTLAVQRDRKDANGEYQTDFIDCVAWGYQAEFVKSYFSKGSMAVVVGRLQSRNWEDKNGSKRTTIEVIADEVHFGENKRQSSPQNTQAYPQAQQSYAAPNIMPDSDFSQMPDDMDDGSVPF